MADQAQVSGQIGMDEQILEDADLEQLLEARQAIRLDQADDRKRYAEANARVQTALASVPIPDDGAVRVGRFRISRRHIAGHAVAFETQPRDQLTIEADE